MIILRRIVFPHYYFNVISLLQFALPPFKALIFLRRIVFAKYNSNVIYLLQFVLPPFKTGFENVLVKAAVNLLQGLLV